MSEFAISTTDLDGANKTLNVLVDTLRQLRASGVQPAVEDMVTAAIKDDTDPMVALARVSLQLVVAIQRLAD